MFKYCKALFEFRILILLGIPKQNGWPRERLTLIVFLAPILS